MYIHAADLTFAVHVKNRIDEIVKTLIEEDTGASDAKRLHNNRSYINTRIIAGGSFRELCVFTVTANTAFVVNISKSFKDYFTPYDL